MADILPPSENCQWVRDRLLFPRFDLPRGQLGGWPGNRGYGTMKNTQGVDLAPPDLGAEWTIQVRTRDRFTLEIESEDRTTVITMGSERTIWLVNHPQDHTDPTPGDPETDFLWYYWMLSRNSGPWPVPTSPEADVDVPHIATAGWPKPRSVVAEAARDPVGTGGQLCRPCEFCPGGG